MNQELLLLNLALNEDKNNENIKNLIKSTKEEILKYETLLKNIKIKFNTEIKDIHKNHSTKSGRKLRKDSILNYGGIITFGNSESNLTRKEMDDFNQEELDNNRNNLIKEILKNLGIENNSYYLVKHIDEEQIHYHFEFIGYDYINKSLIRKSLNQKKLIEIQDLSGECFKSLNFERGKSKWARVNEHCEKNGINYKILDKEEKYNLLKMVNVKHETLKEHNQNLSKIAEEKSLKMEKQLELSSKKINDLNKDFLNFEKLLELVIDRKINLDKIKELQEQHKEDKIKKRFLSYCYRILNKSVNTEKDIKNRENTLKTLKEKISDDMENLSDMAEEELNKRVIKKGQKEFDNMVEQSKEKDIKNENNKPKGGASELEELFKKKQQNSSLNLK